MNVEITDEKLSQLVEAEVRKYVGNRIERVMNDGKAHWFTQQNIERITRECAMSKIRNEVVSECVQSLDKKSVLEAITKGLVGEIGRSLFGNECDYY